MLLNKKGRKIKSILYILVILLSAGLLILPGSAFNDEKTVTITVGNTSKTLITAADTVGQFLEEQKISVGPEDSVTPSFDYRLVDFEANEIVVKKAVRVTVECDGEKIPVLTTKGTIQEVLDQLSIVLSEKDRIVGMRGDTRLVDGLEIKILRVSEMKSTEIEYIPYETKLVENNRMLATDKKVLQEGRPGIISNTYHIVMENGNIASKTLTYQKEIQKAVPRVEEYGTLLQYKTSTGETFTYSKVYNMKATAYTTAYEECGKTSDHPAFGFTVG